MKEENLKSPQSQTLVADGDLHLGLSAQPFDPEAWRQSISTVALADKRWLQKHPKAEYRVRPIDPIEMRMNGRPPETVVLVARGPHGSQIRCFLLPQGMPSETEKSQ